MRLIEFFEEKLPDITDYSRAFLVKMISDAYEDISRDFPIPRSSEETTKMIKSLYLHVSLQYEILKKINLLPFGRSYFDVKDDFKIIWISNLLDSEEEDCYGLSEASAFIANCYKWCETFPDDHNKRLDDKIETAQKLVIPTGLELVIPPVDERFLLREFPIDITRGGLSLLEKNYPDLARRMIERWDPYRLCYGSYHLLEWVSKTSRVALGHLILDIWSKLEDWPSIKRDLIEGRKSATPRRRVDLLALVADSYLDSLIVGFSVFSPDQCLEFAHLIEEKLEIKQREFTTDLSGKSYPVIGYVVRWSMDVVRKNTVNWSEEERFLHEHFTKDFSEYFISEFIQPYQSIWKEPDESAAIFERNITLLTRMKDYLLEKQRKLGVSELSVDSTGGRDWKEHARLKKYCSYPVNGFSLILEIRQRDGKIPESKKLDVATTDEKLHQYGALQILINDINTRLDFLNYHKEKLYCILERKYGLTVDAIDGLICDELNNIAKRECPISSPGISF